MTEAKHVYPPSYPPGIDPELDEAWKILDLIQPGSIPNEVRMLLAGAIAGTLKRYKKERQ